MRPPHERRREKAHLGGRLVAFAIVGFALASLLETAGAQYQPGTLIVTPGLSYTTASRPYQPLAITPSGAVHSLNVPSFDWVSGLMNAPDNRGVWMAGKIQNGASGVFEVAPSAAISTIALFSPVTPKLIGVDGEGGILAELSSRILTVKRGPVITTVSSVGGPGWTLLGPDESRGHLILIGIGSIERLDLTRVPARTTITSWPPASGSPNFRPPAAHDVGTDLMVCGSYHPRGDELIAFPLQGPYQAGVLVRLNPYSDFDAIDITPAWRTAVITIRHSGWPLFGTHSIELFDMRRSVHVRTVLTSKKGFGFYAIHTARAQTRHLSVVAPAQRGGAVSALVSSPAEPGVSYAVAFSLGVRPGIHLPDGRWVWLRPDALFAASLTGGGLFSGCRGVLDPRGEATARMAVPRVAALAGLRVYAVAVTVAGNQIRTVSSPIGVTIQ